VRQPRQRVRASVAQIFFFLFAIRNNPFLPKPAKTGLAVVAIFPTASYSLKCA